jgi:hypothetical protein
MRYAIAVLAVACAATCAASARAADAVAAEDSQPRLSVGVSGVAGMTFGRRHNAPIGDTSANVAATAVAGIRVAPQWRANARWSFGATAGVLAVPNIESGTTRWWDLQAEARYHLLGWADNDLWLGAGAGFVAAADYIPSYTNDLGEAHLARTAKNYAPSGSLAIGHDWALARFIAFGIDLRGIFFGLRAGTAAGGGPQYTPQTGFLLGATLTGRWL